jgi:predicted DNA-binding mobile mystery protein A
MATTELLFQQIDTTLGPLRDSPLSRPRRGWLRAIRTALGMTSKQLAQRLQTSQSAIIEYEQREIAGTISLGTLRRAASAMDCDLVYALVPRQPLRDIVQHRAEDVARRKLSSVAHSMKIEDQGLSEEAMERQVQELARKLIEKRRRELWQ